MASSRDISYKIFSLLKKNPSKREVLLKKLNFSEKDLDKLLCGRLMLSFSELDVIAKVFDVKPEDIVSYENKDSYDKMVSYEGEKLSQENADKILDIIDEYIDIKEAASQAEY